MEYRQGRAPEGCERPQTESRSPSWTAAPQRTSGVWSEVARTRPQLQAGAPLGHVRVGAPSAGEHAGALEQIAGLALVDLDVGQPVAQAAGVAIGLALGLVQMDAGLERAVVGRGAVFGHPATFPARRLVALTAPLASCWRPVVASGSVGDAA